MQASPATLFRAAGIAAERFLNGASILPDAAVRDYLARVALTSYGPTTVTDPEKILAQVMAIRKAGYAEGVNERNLGGVGVAAPVYDHTGAIVAALHVSVPQFRYRRELRRHCLQAVVDGAKAVSERLGYRGRSAGRTAS